MKNRIASFAAVLIAAATFATPGLAQRSKTVEGLAIHMGITNAIAAEHADARHGVHTVAHDKGMEHIVISLAEAKSGKRIGDAKVTLEVVDPKGRVQKKDLLPMSGAGIPDYSEVFHFGWSGRYELRVTVTPEGKARPVKASFIVNHFI